MTERRPQVGPLILYSAAVGAFTGLGAALFVRLLRLVQSLFMGQLLGYLPLGLPGEGGILQVFTGPFFWPLAFLIPLLLALGSWIGTGRGLGYYLQAYRSAQPIRSLGALRSLAASLLQLSGGSPLGREGPLGTLGLWLGNLIGRRFPLGGGRYLTFAGLAAGLASAFHAPLAGALLATEIATPGLSLEVEGLAPALIGSLAGFTVYGAFLGYGPLLELKAGRFNLSSLVFSFLLSGLLAGLYYLWSTATQRLRPPLARLAPYRRHALLGFGLALSLLFLPEALFGGLSWVQLGTSPILSLDVLITLFLAHFLLVLLASITRGYGGYFTPALTLGGLAGLIAGRLLPGLAPDPATAALLGMGSLLAGVGPAPFAAVVLVSEVGGYQLLPLILPAAFFMYALTQGLAGLDTVRGMNGREAAPTGSAPHSEHQPKRQGEPGSPETPQAPDPNRKTPDKP